MNDHTAGAGETFGERERFEAGASRYADYLRTVEGRLRLDLAWANLRAAVADASRDETKTGDMRRALDVGGGTGVLASRLAVEGMHVTVVDSSEAMLALAAETARLGNMHARIAFEHADASELAVLFAPGEFDLAACHNVVEYVDEPQAVIHAISNVVRPGGIVSVLARNRAGETMRAALKAHDLDAARDALNVEQVRESLYGGPARLFDAARLHAMMDATRSLEVIAVRGVRVLADYLPPSLSETKEAYARLLEFEYELGMRQDFSQVARYTQVIAKRI